MYANSRFLTEIKNCVTIITSDLTNYLSTNRISCSDLLKKMKEFTIDKKLIKNEERLDYLNKFKDEAIYFHDILNYDWVSSFGAKGAKKGQKGQKGPKGPKRAKKD